MLLFKPGWVRRRDEIASLGAVILNPREPYEIPKYMNIPDEDPFSDEDSLELFASFTAVNRVNHSTCNANDVSMQADLRDKKVQAGKLEAEVAVHKFSTKHFGHTYSAQAIELITNICQDEMCE